MLVPGATLVFARWLTLRWLALQSLALGGLAQAEPAPLEALPPPPAPVAPTLEAEPRAPLNAIAVHGRFAYRPNDTGSGVPAGGFSLGGTLERRYARVGDVFALGVGLDFFFDRFSTDGTHISAMPRELTQTSFVALQTVTLERLPVRPWVAAGAGIAVGSVATGSSVRPVARGAVGIELRLSRITALVVRADLTHPLSDPGAYGDILDAGVGILERF